MNTRTVALTRVIQLTKNNTEYTEIEDKFTNFISWRIGMNKTSLVAQLVKISACNAGDLDGLIPGWGSSWEEG